MDCLTILKSLIPSYLKVSDENPDGLSDDRLNHYLNVAKEAILNKRHPFGYPDETTMESRFNNLQIEIAKYLVFKEGMEGETYHGENGINRSFEKGIVPESMLRGVTPKAQILW